MNNHKILLSRKNLLLFALVFAAVGGGYLAYKSLAATTYYLSPNGNDSNPCTQIAPCKSLDKAYAVASLGDTVEMASGTYPAQVITQKNGKDAAGDQTDIVFRPAANAAVTIGDIDFGVRGGSLPPAHITIDGQGRTTIGELGFFLPNAAKPATDITIQNLKLARDKGVYLRGNDRLTLRNLEIGPICCSDDGMQVNVTDAFNTSRDVTQLVMDGVYMHDVVRYCSQDPAPKSGCTDDPDSHTDCIQWWSGVNVTIRNSLFYNCSTSTWLLQDEFGGLFGNWTVENNMLGASIEDAVNVFRVACGGECFSGFLNVRHNTLSNNLLVDEGSLAAGTNVKVEGNLINSQGCSDGVTYGNNVVTEQKCASSEKLVSSIGVTKLQAPNSDLHLLPSSGAIDSSPCYLPVDIDGQARSSGGLCDAGADEYNGVVAPPPPPPPPPTTKPGDLNSDGSVTVTDLAILLSNYNSSNTIADINKDGTVTILDLSILLSNYGA